MRQPISGSSAERNEKEKFFQPTHYDRNEKTPVFISTFIPFLILGLLFKDFFTQSEQIEPVWPQAAQLGIYFSNIALTVRYAPN